MAKSRDAFRTISEVADTLDTPAHVLRFWESKFKQIKPVKRAGGRRYYRPDDVALLAAIKSMLHIEGHSIKDAQKLIRETGIKAIVATGHDILSSDSDDDATVDAPIMPPPAAAPNDGHQPDLFAGSEHTTTPAAPEPVENLFTEADSDPAPTIAAEDRETRILGAILSADPTLVKANSTQIAPLLARLSALRDEMRHPW